MGSLKQPLPQGPSQHCSNPEPHEMHMNTEPGTLKGSHCDGVPELPSFIEMTVRVPLSAWGKEDASFEEVSAFVAKEGLLPVVSAIGEPGVLMAIRLRAGGQDRMFPIVKRQGQTGLTAVEMPDEPSQ